ncbi:TIR domain-containing protein [Cereibacter johrii]|uniref:TIR domain-containing protein n=1 Tax=Cereibacter johrii TaxID=445629 RepID=UPI000DCC7B89|nr:nucleotide-binding protein [Cereibacter johrii]RAZ83410.1 hypothetical protein DDV93_13945 [Cereibacter johrii]
MFNLMVTADDNGWEEGVYIWSSSRILEHTDPEIKARLSKLSESDLAELASLPTLFTYEDGTEGSPRVGYIRKVVKIGNDIKIVFEFDDPIGLTRDLIQNLTRELNIGRNELYRTHWAVKNVDLHQVLREAGVLHKEILELIGGSNAREEIKTSVDAPTPKVFIVHGRDTAAKESVARFLQTRVGLNVTILHERPNLGRSILTKFEQEASDAAFAIVLMTGDDYGYIKAKFDESEEAQKPKSRARQNVLFEMGFFIGKLGVNRVCVLLSPGTEKPSDYDGVVYIEFPSADSEAWQRPLVTELHAANIPVSADWWKPA